MALQKEIYCIYQPNQYQISWDKYFQRYQAADEARYLEPCVLGETRKFLLITQKRKAGSVPKQVHLPLAALCHNSSAVLKSTKKRKRGGGSQKVLHQNNMKRKKEVASNHWA